MITSYFSDGDYVRVFTDNPGRNEFVYPANKFSSLAALEAEINKSLALEEKRKMSTSEKFVRLSSALKLNGAVEVAKDEVFRGPN